MLRDPSTQPGTAGRLVSPVAALAATVVVCFALTAAVSWFVETPRIFYDELLYMEAADSLADGDGLEVRGQPYERGPLYPALLAPFLAAAPDREVGYALAKLLNSILFALSAVPVYLLARRLLPPRPSLGVAALAVAVPSSVYVSVVMTESVSYLTACWALLAIVLAVERPTLALQGGAIAAIGVAFLARAQFAVLFAAYLLALALSLWLLPERWARLGASVRSLWPTAAAVIVGLAAFVLLPVARGDSPFDSLGDYATTAKAPNPLETVKWFAQHLAGLELYLAVVPVAVAPIVLVAWFAASRRGSATHAALLATFASVNAALLVVVAVIVADFERSGFAIDRLHDRYLFYVVPLWLIVLVWWIANGAPRPRTPMRVGIILAAVLALLFPYRELDLEDGVKLFSAAGTAFPAAIDDIAGSTVVGAVVTLVLVGLLLVAFRRGATKAAVWALVAVFLVNTLLVWGRAFNPLEEAVFADPGLEQRWVDERVPKGASVTVLESSCEGSVLERDSYFLTEFFNDSIGEVVDMVGEERTGTVAADGAVLADGAPLEAEYVVAQPGVGLSGTEIASGTAAGLVLWEVRGPVRVIAGAQDGGPDGFCLDQAL